MSRCPACDQRVETHAPGISYVQFEAYGPKWHPACAEEERRQREPAARIERHRDANRAPGTAERIENDGSLTL